MRRIIGFTVFSVFFASLVYATTVVEDTLKSYFNILSKDVSTEMAKNMGTYTGVGNVTPMDTKNFFSLNVGLSGGLYFSSISRRLLAHDPSALEGSSGNETLKALQTIGNIPAAIPYPYDSFSLKFGLPKTGVPMVPDDLGLRLGFVPKISYTDPASGAGVSAGMFLIGAEGRYILFDSPGGIFRIDGRLSIDYNSGGIGVFGPVKSPMIIEGVNVGTNQLDLALDYSWGGVSLGSKIMTGLNIPIIGGVYGGLGLNVNLGAVTTKMTAKGTFYPSTGGSVVLADIASDPEVVWYSPLDLKLILGAKLFFANGVFEYNFFNQSYAVTIFPISLAF